MSELPTILYIARNYKDSALTKGVKSGDFYFNLSTKEEKEILENFDLMLDRLEQYNIETHLVDLEDVVEGYLMSDKLGDYSEISDDTKEEIAYCVSDVLHKRSLYLSPKRNK